MYFKVKKMLNKKGKEVTLGIIPLEGIIPPEGLIPYTDCTMELNLFTLLFFF